MNQVDMEQLHSFLTSLEIGSGDRFDWRIEGPLFASASSTIYRATRINGTGPTVAIKSAAPREVKEQYEALVVGRDRLQGHSDCHVPLPLGYLEAEGFLAMEWIDAPSLKTIMLSPMTSRRRLEHLAQQAGEWLAAFHNNDKETCSLDPRVMLDQIDECREARESRLPRRIDETIRFLHSTTDRLVEHPMPKVLLHGDFKPSNFLVTDNATFGIDLTAQHVDVAAYDIAQFVNQLILECYHPKAILHCTRQHEHALAFLAGYRSSLDTIPDFPLRWMMLAKFVTQFLQLGKAPLISRKRYLGIFIQREIDRLLTAASV